MFSRLMEAVFGASATWACPTEQLLIREESRVVEYKQTARWNVREQRRDKTMAQVVVKTVAGMLNDRGGTLLIGVTDNGEPVGLERRLRPGQPAERRRLRELARHALRAQPRPRRCPPSHHPNRPDRPSGHLPHRRSSQLSPHLGQEQQRPQHPLPTPQQLHEASTA